MFHRIELRIIFILLLIMPTILAEKQKTAEDREADCMARMEKDIDALISKMKQKKEEQLKNNKNNPPKSSIQKTPDILGQVVLVTLLCHYQIQDRYLNMLLRRYYIFLLLQNLFYILYDIIDPDWSGVWEALVIRAPPTLTNADGWFQSLVAWLRSPYLPWVLLILLFLLIHYHTIFLLFWQWRANLTQLMEFWGQVRHFTDSPLNSSQDDPAQTSGPLSQEDESGPFKISKTVDFQLDFQPLSQWPKEQFERCKKFNKKSLMNVTCKYLLLGFWPKKYWPENLFGPHKKSFKKTLRDHIYDYLQWNCQPVKKCSPKKLMKHCKKFHKKPLGSHVLAYLRCKCQPMTKDWPKKLLKWNKKSQRV
ncbi:uncharacterized protein [Aquarana catesbeiana]|uniref:uncharacterized protein n=1 Tax=Aquarana catesbeiana TaxID=8400 RepID=UPI003CCA4A8D